MSITNKEPFEDIFVIKVSEIQHLALEKYGRMLDEVEIREVQKRLQWGLECWEEVAIYAIEDVMDKKI